VSTITECRILPESVVFLYANNRVDEAERVIRNAAKLNNIAMPGSILAARSLEIIVPSTKPTAPPNDTKNNYTINSQKTTISQPVLTQEKLNGFMTQKGENGAVLYNLERFKRAKEKAASMKKTRYTILDVFRNCRLATYCVCMSFLWFVTLRAAGYIQTCQFCCLT